MSIYGNAQLNQTLYEFVRKAGQEELFTFANERYAIFNDEIAKATAVFVAGRTESHQIRYRLPGTGTMQRRGNNAPSGTRREIGYWDVGFPLENFGAALGWNDVDYGYLQTRPEELLNHILTIEAQANETYVYEMLRAMFNNVARTFEDPLNGSLTVQPLANGDSVVYPPTFGATSAGTRTRYAGSNYTSANISNTNNPIFTIVSALELDFGFMQGGDNIAVFIHTDQVAKVKELTDFVDLPDIYVVTGQDTPVPSSVPTGLPGRVIGRCSGAWIVEWPRVPTGYMLGVHLGVEAPLRERVHPVATGLPAGLHLKARDMRYPMETAEYRFDFGIGVANRLNGYALHITNSTSYTIPAAYA